MKIYLSGPMTGLPDFNFPAFHSATAKLRALGHDVFNPAEVFAGEQGRPYAEYMREDIAAVLACECVVTLDGWQKSKGANLEVSIADVLDLPILPFDEVDWEMLKP